MRIVPAGLPLFSIQICVPELRSCLKLGKILNSLVQPLGRKQSFTLGRELRRCIAETLLLELLI